MDYNLIYQELLTSIKNSELAFEIKESLTDIYNDKTLINSILKYKSTKDDNLRKEIYNNEKFKRYKRLENQANILIMKLNKIFKELGDNNESNKW